MSFCFFWLLPETLHLPPMDSSLVTGFVNTYLQRLPTPAHGMRTSIQAHAKGRSVPYGWVLGA